MARESIQTLTLRRIEELSADIKSGFTRFEDKLLESDRRISNNEGQIARLTSIVEQVSNDSKAILDEMRREREKDTTEFDTKINGIQKHISDIQTFVDIQIGINKQKEKVESNLLTKISIGATILVAIGGTLYVSYTGSIANKSVAEMLGGGVAEVTGMYKELKSIHERVTKLESFIVPQ